MPLSSFTIRDSENRKQSVEILHEDAHLLAVNKPPGLAVIPDHWDPEIPNLRALLEQKYEKLSGETGKPVKTVWVAHRIDADTSGVVLFAHSAEMHRELNLLFEDGQVRKTYLAVTRGRPPAAEGAIELPLQPHPTRPQFMQVHKQGKPSLTHYRVAETFKHYALLEISPQTGRTHQIRVHLKEIRCPLAIDPLYGSGRPIDLSLFKRDYVKKDPFEENRPLISRLTLHAWRLQFRDPFAGEERTFEAPPPKDFTALLKALRRWDAA